ncbi:hypothetical protein GWA97_00670 [Flavobacterium sp. LaA7.5]|nr:hypothetical protein [Flavobacterium salilacus subsp. altitudinum]
MKNILFYYSWQTKPVHFGIVIEKLHSIIDEMKGKEGKIYFMSCDGPLKPCYTNRHADPAVCSICRFNNDIGLKPFGDKIETIKLSEFTKKRDYPVYDYTSVEDIKKIKYKDVNIGYGALSSYISFTRNLEPVMDADFRKYFDSILNSQVNLTEALLEIIENKKITNTYFFNGRTADTRPLYDISKSRDIPFISLEMIRKKKDEFYINEFINCLPHDIDFHTQRMNRVWDESQESVEEKVKIGSAFFENRRNGILVRDKRVYTAGQQQGLLPDNWDNNKRNIAIFVSSEDEFAAIGDIFEKLAVFKTQETGIINILEHFANNNQIHFYIRLHPNLAKVTYSYHTRLVELQDKYANLTIIRANSKISTYALIDTSSTVIAFGSTTGVEACYWGKPVILLAGSIYYHLNVSYKPKSMEELYSLLMQDLEPKPKVEAAKYGYYLMSYSKYTRKNKFSPVPLKALGKDIGLGHHHLKIFGSKILYRITERSLQIISNKFFSKKITIPRKGI